MDTTLHKIAIVDATGSGKGKRRFTRDAIGAGSHFMQPAQNGTENL